MNKLSPTITVILPCRNEEQALGGCIEQIKAVFNKHQLDGEIIVSDSSTDSSPAIAQRLGVKLVKHDQTGYGRAYLEGFEVAQGRYIFMADADGTYDFNEIPNFLKYLDQGYDLVIGNRFAGKIEKKAMPWTHRYFGNPLLSFLLRLFFKTKVNDAHCGMRAITQEALKKMNLKTTGMEFASEMIIVAASHQLKIKQLPIDYYRRKGQSKLKSFSDGWRHLRFMLMYAPDYLFLIPGVLFVLLGIVLAVLLKNNIVYASFLIILGYQVLALGVFTKAYMKSIGFITKDKLVDSLAKMIKFETGIFIGITFLLITFLISQKTIFDFMVKVLNIPPDNIIIIALTIAVIGIQTMFSAFLISILLVEKK